MRALLDLILPTQCIGCGRAGPVACSDCGLSLQAPARVRMPTPCPAGLPSAHSVTPYDDIARAMLVGYKENGVVALHRPLGAALARAVGPAMAIGPGHPVAIVPVPSSRAARRRRGFDPVGALAVCAAAALRAAGGDATVVRALRHQRPVADSVGLDAAGRAANLAGAFAVRPRSLGLVRGRSVVLVDDLITTGATLAECARALRGAGVEVSGVATIAATARRSR